MIRHRLVPAALLLISGFLTSAAAGDRPTAELNLDLQRYRGQVVLLDFWASWCDPCRQSFPWMAEMTRRHGDRGFVVVAVNLDEEPEAADGFRAQMEDAGFEHLSNPSGSLAERYGVEMMPTSILFDREGRPVYRHGGFHAEKIREYEAHVVELLDGDVDRDAIALKSVHKKRGVRPWQRGNLADQAMQLGNDPLELDFDDHIYFSKEASSGGRGFGGGGCGCN